jgi:hypothetical protein
LEKHESLSNIKKIIQENDPKRETPFSQKAPIHFFDKGYSYYFTHIDEFVSFVVIFEKQSDNSASEFIMEVAKKLSGVEILVSLTN